MVVDIPRGVTEEQIGCTHRIGCKPCAWCDACAEQDGGGAQYVGHLLHVFQRQRLDPGCDRVGEVEARGLEEVGQLTTPYCSRTDPCRECSAKTEDTAGDGAVRICRTRAEPTVP